MRTEEIMRGRASARPDYLRPHLPSRRDIFSAFAFWMWPIHTWAVITFLRQIPSLLLPHGVWEVVASAAYTVVFALWESLIVTIILVLLAAIWGTVARLIGRTTRGSMAYASLTFVGIWAVLLGRHQPWPFFLAVVAGLGAALFLCQRVVRRHAGVRCMILSLIRRLEVLAWLYLTIDVAAVIVVMARNV